MVDRRPGEVRLKPDATYRGAVADPQAAVTDTHAIIFHAAGGGKLGPKAAAFYNRCERREAILYVPGVVIWECSLLARVARINLRRTVRAFFDDLFSNPSYQPLDVTPEQSYLADELRFNRDPFDALICAAARTIDLPLITRDADIRGSGVVRVIW
jgi:PIN domain nuclease of toxin-antitoxin system